MKRMRLADRQKMKAAERRAKATPAPAPIEDLLEEEDAAELEYQEKTVKKKRTRRNKDEN